MARFTMTLGTYAVVGPDNFITQVCFTEDEALLILDIQKKVDPACDYSVLRLREDDRILLRWETHAPTSLKTTIL